MKTGFAAVYLQGSENVKIALRWQPLANDVRLRRRQMLVSFYLVSFVIFSTASACFANTSAPDNQAEARQKAKDVPAADKLNSVSLRITGSMCPACLKQLKEKLGQLAGVTDVKITPLPVRNIVPSLKLERHPPHRKALIELDFDPELIAPYQIIESIKQNDFGVSSVSTHKGSYVKQPS